MTKQQGMTLVELMIAMAIAIIMMTGLIQILIANRQAYRVMEGANFMQENMRFSVERLAYAGRMAANWSAIRPATIQGATPAGANAPCTVGWARQVTQPVEAWNGAAIAPAALAGCFDAAQYEPNTDVVAMRYAEADPLPLAASLDSNQLYLASQTEYGFGILFNGASGFPVFPPTDRGRDPQTRLSRITVELFWVRRCNDPGADNVCGNADDGDFENPVPTLMRGYFNTAGAWLSEPLADGMEQLQVEFQAARAGPWLAAGSPGLNWNAVTGMRLAGISRSAQRDNAFPADVRTFQLSADVPAHTPTGVAAKTLRTRFESTIAFRNFYRSR